MGASQVAGRRTRLFRPTHRFLGNMRALRRLVRDRSGNVAILAALMFPVIIGGMGLGVEVGFWHYNQRKLQHAADVAAYAAGVRKKAGDSKQALEKVAAHVASESGVDAVAGVVTVNTPPTSGSHAGNSKAVEVILDETVPRAFTSLFLADDLKLSGRAVVVAADANPACVLALHPSKQAAIELTGNADVALSGCHIAANSSDPDAFSMDGNADLTVDCVHTVGGAYVQKKHKLDMECDAVEEGISPVADPYADLAAPDCGGPKVYCHAGGLSLKNKTELAEGIYIINGGTLEFTANANVTGKNITFFLTNGATVEIKGNAKFNLTAPTDPAEPYAGMLFFGDRNDNSTGFEIKGNASGSLQGAIYFPSGHAKFTGNGDITSECIQVIADTVTLTGNSDFKANCTSAGVRELSVSSDLKIVE
jgi:hypothetical protein